MAAGNKPPPDDDARAAEEAEAQATGALRPVRPSRWSAAFRAVSGFQVGEVVGGRFRITRFIASGGMGEVYEAEDLELGERVALKTIRPEVAEDEQTVERFRREIQLARKVTHPSVCRSYDLFRHRLPAPPGWSGPMPEVIFLSMELLEGETLGERIKSQGAMSPEQALPILRQVAAALAAAHEQGIVHRDLKSSNVVLVPGPKGVRAVVTDFGLARHEASSAGRLTGTGAMAGTPAYMAPEQVEGAHVGPAADVYALGVVLYEMVTGRLPFTADSPLGLAMQRLKEEPPSPRTHVPGLDAKWEAAIMRCLERRPADRFAGPLDVVSALEGEPVAPSPRQTRRRRRMLLIAAAAIGFVALNAAALMFMRSRTSPQPSGRRSVAVLGFGNLSGRAEAAWLGTALSEMLTMELGSGGSLRVISGESVARMRAELSLPETHALAPDALERVRKNLGIDLVVQGTYFDAGKEAGGKLRLDLRVRDATDGSAVVSLSDTGTEAEFLELVSRVGAQLRGKLGAGGPAATASARPTLLTGAAARPYAEGLERLRRFDPLAARDLLEKAVAADPASPLTHAALADAWAALGYGVKAKEEARLAFEHSSALPREERLAIEARFRDLSGERSKAVEIHRILFQFVPDDLEYGLRLADAQSAAGQGKDALATIEQLRKLPAPAGEDPRIDLAEARAGEVLGDFRRARAAALRAAGKGRQTGAGLLVARARLGEASALVRLGEYAQAEAAAAEARAACATAGDRSCVGRALMQVAGVFWRQGDFTKAQSAAAEAIAIAREVGDKAVLVRAVNVLAITLNEQGRLSEAAPHHEETLAIAREIGDTERLGAALNNLGDNYMKRGELSRARQKFEEQLDLARQRADHNLQAFGLVNIGEVLYNEGDLRGASTRLDEALAIARSIGLKQIESAALFNEAEVARAQSDLPQAQTRHRQAHELRRGSGEKVDAAESLLALATLTLDDGRPAEAEAPLREVLAAFHEARASHLEALAHVVMAQVSLARGKPDEATRAIEQARTAGGRLEYKRIGLQLAITSGRVRAATGHAVEASRELEAALAEAKRTGYFGLQLEARLAVAEAATTATRREPLIASLITDAEGKGYALVARKARALRK